jgi:hypothetical protein
MDPRLESLEAFRASIASLNLPLTDEELETAWAMARDLREQADSLRDAVQALRGSRHLVAPVDDPDGRTRG